MKLIKESLFEFEKYNSIKDTARVGILNKIKDEMKADGEEYKNLKNAYVWCLINNKIEWANYIKNNNFDK